MNRLASHSVRPRPRQGLRATLLLALGLIGTAALAQEAARAPAAAPVLDPSRLMQGFPPPPEYRVDALNWQQYPQKIWSFQHTRELFPTRGLQPQGPVRALPAAPQAFFETLEVGTPEARLSWPQLLAQNNVDAALVLHRGRIVDERYFNGMTAATPHLMFSATKSMAGLMAATAIAEGKLDENAKVGALLPELADSAWGGATVRQMLDMTDGVKFSEDYKDPNSDIYAYAAAMGWTPPEMRNAKQVGILAMLPSIKRVHEEARGTVFRYRSAATDVVAWLAMRATGQSLTAWLQQRLWNRLGMEYPGHVMLDPAGTEVAFAGMSASARDLARIGQLLLDQGRVGGEQVLPAAIAAELARGGDRQAFSAGMPQAANAAERSYRSQWWVTHKAPRAFAAQGAFGQRLVVYPDHGLVLVLLSSHRQASLPQFDLLIPQAATAMLRQLEAGR